MPRHTYPLNRPRSAPTVACARAVLAVAAVVTASRTAASNFRRNMVSPFVDGENKKPASDVEAGLDTAGVTRTAARNLYVKAWSRESGFRFRRVSGRMRPM